MRSWLLPLVLLAGSCAVPQSDREQEAELSRAPAGPAQRCLMLNQLDSLHVSRHDPHTLVYGNGRTFWLNHLGECSFRPDDILVTEPTGSQLCGGDIVRSLDRNSRIPGPSCVLGEFVPYKR